MTQRLLIANRGEIAIRIAQSAYLAGWTSIGIFSEDDRDALHIRRVDHAVPLSGRGAKAYLDRDGIIALARNEGCTAIHPGYGFLSESAEFAAACEANGLVFVGPSAKTLALFGDKARARAFARQHDVPVLPGTSGPTSLEEAEAFFAAQGPNAAVMVKAIAGGGGRGMRQVETLADLKPAIERCRSEAQAAFGVPDIYLERLVRKARHIEIQVIGDGTAVASLGERECSIQRRHQKLIEIAPAPNLSSELLRRIETAALDLARASLYRGLGTFEFLVDAAAGSFFFIEANPRLQVEHTVTEQVTGLDLVGLQLRLAEGAKIDALGVESTHRLAPRGFAIQMRINAETTDASGTVRPSSGHIAVFEPPSGPGIRVDSCAYAGYVLNPNFDSLIAKLIVTSPASDFATAVKAAQRALGAFRVEGIETNAAHLAAILALPEFVAADLSTNLVGEHASALAAAATTAPQQEHFFRSALRVADSSTTAIAPPGTKAVLAPMLGRVIELCVKPGEDIWPGKEIAILEAMKMEHVVLAQWGGTIALAAVEIGATIQEGSPLFFVREGDVETQSADHVAAVDLDTIRPDLAELLERLSFGQDATRPDAVAKRRRTGQRTARENLADLCDPGSFIEYGALNLAAQRRRRTLDDLIRNTPADGLLAGAGTVNAELFGKDASRCVAVIYDFTVLAGTQGSFNHRKLDRMLDLAREWHAPVVLFAEGGGGRPGDTDALKVAGLDTPSFASFAKLSGKVPLVGVVSGRCFAGNAALLGCCDAIIATRNSNIGMGGPAMIEGGGLGVFAPEDIGPIDVQTKNGVVDIAVEDEEEATVAAKNYLSYFQGARSDWQAADQRLLRSLIPENRLRTYDMRRVVEALCDEQSVLELRAGFGIGIITALVRIAGKPFGLIANNPHHLSGAIDAEAADKASRFMRLCNAFGLPLLSLIDTPGFMVGPEAEKDAQVRRVCRMFLAGASLRVPFFAIVLRKGYGLGAQAMAAGSFHAPVFNIAWPSGEFGGMGLEGAVRLGYRKELQAIADAAERDAEYRRLVDEMYARGKAINMASYFEIDAVIDPSETRDWILRGLTFAPRPPSDPGAAYFIDSW
jgi:acetyl/propionyl-CoA carboxylase alpha subunit/acetyl-CoA carboxylase carboxyltransferase component